VNGSGIAAVPCQAPRLGSAPDLPVLLGLLAFSLLARAVALPHPVADPDESLYFVQAQRWLRGEWPYSTGVWDLHPVGAPALLAAAFAVFGEAVWVARVLASLAVGATAFLLHRMLVASGAGWQAGIAAGLLYSAHTLRLGGLATNTEVLFAPFVAGAVLVLYRAILSVAGGRAARLRDAVAAGLLFGVAIWIKYVAAFEAALAGCLLPALALRHRRAPLRRVLALAAAYAAACWAPTAATALAYAGRGEFGDFASANFGALLRYIGPESAEAAVRAVLSALFSFALPAGLALLSVLWRLRRPSAWPAARRALLAVAAAWFAAAAVGAAATGKYYTHYFLALLPALSAASGLALARAGESLALPGRRGTVVVAAAAIAAAAPLAEDAAMRARSGLNIRMNDAERQVAAAVRRHLAAGERLWVVNYQPVVYFLAGAKPASRHVHPTHLTGRQRHVAVGDAAAEVSRVLASRPEIIVLGRGGAFDPRDPADPALIRTIAAALAEDYAPVEVIEREVVVEVHRLRGRPPSPLPRS
jgi:4-amino-4-deoxy-L-arabinose transferase-like glycosyltransferase